MKQEYLPAGQTLERFEAMMLVEFMPGEATTAEIARAQTRMLDERRAFDPLVNYAILLADDGWPEFMELRYRWVWALVFGGMLSLVSVPVAFAVRALWLRWRVRRRRIR